LDSPSAPSTDAVMFRWPFYVPKKIRDRDDKEAFLLQYKEMHNLLPTPRFADLRVIGQLGKTYLLCEGGGELVIVDQHAAHERIVLHRLQQNMSKQLGGLQQFLTPEIIEVSVQRYHALLPRLDVLEYYGFSIEPFGSQTFVIRQAPITLMNINYQEMLEGVADSIQEGIETTPLKEKIDLMLATKACHNSIRAGETLSELQIQNLLHELDGVDFEVCAHGRPVVIRYAMSEFEKRFHRN
jgi:DNA mismatch repair protein MutL